MKRFALAVSALLLATLTLTACESGDEAEEAPAEATKSDREACALFKSGQPENGWANEEGATTLDEASELAETEAVARMLRDAAKQAREKNRTQTNVLTNAVFTFCQENGHFTSDEAPVSETDTATATPQQLASIIAQYKDSWLEVIDGATDCYLWNSNPLNVEEMTGAVICQTEMRTMSLEALLATREFEELTPPADMQPLVNETLIALAEIDGYDKVLTESCAGQTAGDITVDCGKALIGFGDRTRDLERVLAKWGPYL